MLACQYNQPKRPGDLDLWPFDLESGARVTCDVGYLCANFSLPRPLCSRLGRMYAADRRQTDVRHKHRLMSRLLGAGHNKLCAWRHNMPPSLSSLSGRRSASRRRPDRNIPRQYVPTLTAAVQVLDALTRRWVKRPRNLDLWPFDPESGVKVTCDVIYLYANFSIPRPFCSWLRPKVRDRQTDVRQTSNVRVRQHHRLSLLNLNVLPWQRFALYEFFRSHNSRSKVNLQGAGAYCGGLSHSLLYLATF